MSQHFSSLAEVLAEASRLESLGQIASSIELLVEIAAERRISPVEWLWYEICQKSYLAGRTDLFQKYCDVFLSSPSTRAENYRVARLNLIRRSLEKQLGSIESRAALADELLALGGTESDVSFLAQLGYTTSLNGLDLCKSDKEFIVPSEAPAIRVSKFLTKPHYVFDLALRRSRHPITISTLSQCQYFSTGEEFALIDRNGRFLDTASHSPQLLRSYEKARLLCGTPLRLGGRAVVLSDRFSGDNYCHWILDWLCRAIVAADVVGRVDWLCGRVQCTPLQEDSLQFFRGLEHARILADGKIRWYQFDEVVLCNNRDIDRTHPAFWGDERILDKMRSEAVSRAWAGLRETKSRRRILISRSDAGYRRGLVNEAEVLAALSLKGFERVVLSEMSIGEQIRLFSTCEAVVGVHGAGFTNILFMEPGALVCEIMHHSYGTPAYLRLASSLDLSYLHMSCASSDVQDFVPATSHSNNGTNASVYVDPMLLLRGIEEIMAS